MLLSHLICFFKHTIEIIFYCLHQSQIFDGFVFSDYILFIISPRGTQCSWSRHWATNQKVVGLIPDGVIGIFR